MAADITAVLTDLEEHSVRNRSELASRLASSAFSACGRVFEVLAEVESLRGHIPEVNECVEVISERMQEPLSQVDAVSLTRFAQELKGRLKNAEVDIKDAKRRISAAKGPRAKRAKAAAQQGSGDETDISAA